MKWFKKKRIVVPFDFSADSIKALEFALSVADEHGRVHVVHVLEALPQFESSFHWEPSHEHERCAEVRQSVKECLAAKDIQNVQVKILVGDPAEEIVEFANELDTDLIVISSHGYSAVKQFFLGSVAKQVVRGSKCPVMVMKH